MASLFSSIFKAVNKNGNISTPLNILCINEDEIFQYNLAKTNHNFYYLQPPKTNKWNTNIRPKPGNCYFLRGNGLQDQLKQDVQFDLILCQNKFSQFGLLMEISKQISCPVILAENNLSEPGMNPHHVEAASNQEYNFQVFNSSFLANSWGFDEDEEDISINPYGIDTEYFNNRDKKYETVCGVLNPDEKLKHITGIDIFNAIAKDFDVDTANINDNYAAKLNMYQTCGVFLNTSKWIACPVYLLEAMSVGCPVITTNNTVLSSIVCNGVNGYITNDVDEMKTHLTTILNDNDLANTLGKNARQTIVEMFDMGKFVKKWNNIFNTSVGKTSTAFKGNRNATVRY